MNYKYYFINKFDTNNINKQDKHTIIIYRNYNLKLKLDGAYIPSFNNSFNHLSFSIRKNFSIIGSAHNIKEIKIKEKQQVKKIVLSSLFKKNKNYLGFYKFKLLSKLTRRKIIVLGGVSKKNIKKIKLLGMSEFAGISYFE